eukprot:evm.model.scf_515.3 EVM.evm.TU.scf_515.3   scf_515:9764-12088(+)
MAEMMEDGPDFRISRQRERELDKLSRGMVRFLRHDPSVAQDPAGWVPLPSLLENLRWTAALHEVQWIVDNNNKKRLVLDIGTNPPRIRAAQGHSVQLAAPELDPVNEAGQVPLAFHVTGWEG